MAETLGIPRWSVKNITKQYNLINKQWGHLVEVIKGNRLT